MRKSFMVLPAVFAAAVLGGTAVRAHHSFSMFDSNTEIVKTGTVVRWAFNNPHSWLYVNVPNEDGTETLWSLEGSSPTSLIARGVTGSTFEPGDEVQVMLCPLRDGRTGGAIGWAKLADGSFVNPADGGCNGNEENQKRWQTWLQEGYTSSVEAEQAQ